MKRGLFLAVMLLAAPAHGFEYGRAPEPRLHLSSYEVGQSPTHALGFSVFRGELETYRVVLDYPDSFRFRGFDALGPNGSEVGALTLDVDNDGLADLVVPLRSLTPGAAYADVVPDGRFSPGLEPVLRHADGTRFVLRVPLGGDADATTVVARFDARVTLALFAGVLANPRQPGSYLVSARLLSVDPDTDGADDGAGAPPMELAFDVAVDITAPPVVPFAVLCIDKADVADARFSVQGRYILGPGSDGAAVPDDTVTVTFAGFQQAISGSAFKALGQGAQFLGHAPGIKRLHLAADGRFQIDARDVDLPGVDRSGIPFTLQIGDDRGAVTLDFDRNGHLRRSGAPACTP